ncbi:hypothetical protein CRENBAI_009230 [Crenichthys baileyi]|uniref:Uncharacterized protein n=1 Tax=Crenichthys baileyi TaxID=28760 RepID=A0AAV9R8R1_9TELE
MCLETMDTETAKFSKPEYLRHGSKPTWTPFRDQTEVKRSFQQHRNTTAVQKHPSREQMLAKRAKLGPFVTDSGKKKKKGKGGLRNEELAASACMYLPPAGGMAPRNTTQYLMSNVYEDLTMDPIMKSSPHVLSCNIYNEALSPSSVSAALDSCFEDILEYQLRDFEELYDLTWKPE